MLPSPPHRPPRILQVEFTSLHPSPTPSNFHLPQLPNAPCRGMGRPRFPPGPRTLWNEKPEAWSSIMHEPHETESHHMACANPTIFPTDNDEHLRLLSYRTYTTQQHEPTRLEHSKQPRTSARSAPLAKIRLRAFAHPDARSPRYQCLIIIDLIFMYACSRLYSHTISHSSFTAPKYTWLPSTPLLRFPHLRQPIPLPLRVAADVRAIRLARSPRRVRDKWSMLGLPLI